ncbi:hypothetical protein LDENG_00148640 [Lucifuga dentata]|nr:hypothetical protein LDENG_00148640 [Lucifuga dentata]
MLADGFLSVLPYREERQFGSGTKPHRTHTHTHTKSTDPFNDVQPGSFSGLQTSSAEAGPNQEVRGPAQTQRHKEVPPAVAGLSIPGCLPILDSDLSLDLGNCSFLQHPGYAAQQGPQSEPGSFAADQGYLVMGSSVNISLDLPGSGLEPMSNSVLNGLLEKQVEEVYLQHLTDNLARCNSHLGNSLLHGLVPPPQEVDSVESGLQDEELAGQSGKISYLNTQNLVPCSSNFSSPMLRISEAENVHLQ